MATVRELHNQAMELAEQAFVARHRDGNEDLAVSLDAQALPYEVQAARQVPTGDERTEPTRAVLFRSAASLAWGAKMYREAMVLIGEAFRGSTPPEQIAAELHELRATVVRDNNLAVRSRPGQTAAPLPGQELVPRCGPPPLYHVQPDDKPTAMRPIVLRSAAIRALWEQGEMQVLRPLRPQPPAGYDFLGDTTGMAWQGRYTVELHNFMPPTNGMFTRYCPYGAPGSLLWVKEEWAEDFETVDEGTHFYRAGVPVLQASRYTGQWAAYDPVCGIPLPEVVQWKPAVSMPYYHCRFHVQVRSVYPAQTRDLTDAELQAAGLLRQRLPEQLWFWVVQVKQLGYPRDEHGYLQPLEWWEEAGFIQWGPWRNNQ